MTIFYRANNRDKRPTWTHLTLEALRVFDDFMSFSQLMIITGANVNQMSATLHHLQKVRAVEAVEENGDVWFCVSGFDNRTKVVEERRPEEPGTRRRRHSTVVHLGFQQPAALSLQ